MQLLSHGLLLGAQNVPPVDPRFEGLQERPVFVGLLIVGWIFLRIFACWFASKAVAHAELATFRRAFLLFLCETILLLVAVVAVRVLVPLAGKLEPGWNPAIIAGGIVMLVVATFAVTMKIYSIGFWRSFALLLFAGGIESAVSFGVQKTTGLPVLSAEEIAALSGQRGAKKELWIQFFQRFIEQEEPDEIDQLLDEAMDPAFAKKPLAEREAAVVTLQRKLGDRKLALQPGDTDAAAIFERQLARYLQFLEDVKAGRRAASPADAH